MLDGGVGLLHLIKDFFFSEIMGRREYSCICIIEKVFDNHSEIQVLKDLAVGVI